MGDILCQLSEIAHAHATLHSMADGFCRATRHDGNGHDFLFISHAEQERDKTAPPVDLVVRMELL